MNIGIGAQSPDIAQGVDTAHEARVEGAADPLDSQGAGDQGLMFGYAINDTPELMPLPIALAHRLSRRLTEVRKNGTLPYLRPDGKTQVTIEYEDDVPVRLDTVVISTQHAADIDLDKTLDPDIREHVLKTVLADLAHDTLDSSSTRVLVNPTGKFVLGGPMGDAGLTGRKIIVDTYGGWARHGGGAFSGKDPSKVDRSAAYAMRWVAKNIVAAGLAERVEVQVAYAIGKAAPVGLFIETFGTAIVDPVKIEKIVPEVFDLRPGAIIRDLDLLRPIYAQTAAYGHFGRTDIDLPVGAARQGRRPQARDLAIASRRKSPRHAERAGAFRLLAIKAGSRRQRVVGFQCGQPIDAFPVAAFDLLNVFLVGLLAVIRVQHWPFVDEFVVGHRVSAGVGDPFDIDHDRGPGTRVHLREMRSETLELGIVGAKDPPGAEQSQDPRVAGKRAEHEGDPAVVTQVCDDTLGPGPIQPQCYLPSWVWSIVPPFSAQAHLVFIRLGFCRHLSVSRSGIGGVELLLQTGG